MDTYMHSKLYTPDPGDLIVPRQRLYTILDSVYNNKTVCISAPAGYGKTTTVTEWLKERGLKSAWVSLDEDDNNAVRFMRYLCASVGGYLSDAIHSAGADPYILLDKLLYALQDCKDEFILVLDDCHHIHDPQIHTLLLRFIQYKPPCVRLVITGRNRVPAIFEPAVLKQHIMVIHDQQLLFSKKEIRAFFKLRQVKLDNNQIDELKQKTEGWPCALVAMSLAVTPRPDKSQIPSSANNGYIHSFLRNEVWERWDEDTRAFFLKTSILNEFSISLAQIVTEMDNCHEILDTIYINQGFLITLDAEEGWYRYHHVFRSFLRMLLEKDEHYDIIALYRHAAGYYRDTGDMVRALSYYKSARDYRGMMGLIHDNGASFLHALDPGQAIQTIDDLAPYGASDDLRVMVCYGWALEFSRQFDKAETLVKSLREKLKAQRSYIEREEAARIHVEICALSLPFSLQAASTRKMLYNFREVLKAQDVDTIVFNPASFPAIMGNKFTLLDTVYGFFGRINHYMNFTKKTLDMVYKALRKQYENVGSLPVARAEILYQLDRIDEALPYLCQGVEESENGLLRIYIPAMLCLADIQKAKGDMAGAYHTIEKCGDRLKDRRDYLGLEIVYAYKAGLDMECEDMDAVRQWEKQIHISPYDTITYHALYQYLTLAHVLIYTNRMTQARLLLQKIELFINDMPAIIYRIQVKYLLACLMLKEGDRPLAAENLLQALSLGFKHGYFRIFADRGEAMKALLDLALEEKMYKMNNGPTQAYLHQLVEATDVYMERTKNARSQKAYPFQEDMAIMTPRELDILQCLSKNMTNQEIADRIFVSLQTVKNYTSRIYRKLGVSGRMQAVGVAKDIGLIP